MTEAKLIQAVVQRMKQGPPGFAGDLLRAMAVATRDRVFRAEALEQANADGLLQFTHQAMGHLVGVDYANWDAWTIAQVAGEAFEEGNYHSEAAAVREMGYADTDTKVVTG